MNYETNVRQLVVLHSMYIFFFMAMQLIGRLLNTTPQPHYQIHIYILESMGPNFDNDPCKIWMTKKRI